MDELDILGRRLDPASDAPLIVAFSGGGDSLALLLTTHLWARRTGRRVIAVTVDHRLQAAGADWSAWCAERAGRLGVEHLALAWEGDKPSTGIPAAARQARHALLADAARAAGARVILMGHTADDRLEARLMRAAGVPAPEPREWSPSPLWPRGRGLFLLRPLLGLRRSRIRERLRQAGETWIDDPANLDARHPRVRARLAIEQGEAPGPEQPASDLAPMLAHTTVTDDGEIILEREAFPLLGQALLCAAGTSRPPRRDHLERLLRPEPFTATLAGARIVSDGQRLRITREPGELIRAGLQPQPLVPGEPTVWDGRYEITAHHPNLTVAPCPPRTRITLPSIDPLPPGNAPSAATITCLVRDRFLAACGAIANEAALSVNPSSARQ